MTTSTTASFREAVRFWWIHNGEHVGLVLAVLLMTAILAPFLPRGRSTPLTGVVTAVNVQGGRNQPAFNAWVDLGGSRTIVGLPAEHECVVGSRIALRKVRALVGEHYVISGNGCDVSPAAR